MAYGITSANQIIPIDKIRDACRAIEARLEEHYNKTNEYLAEAREILNEKTLMTNKQTMQPLLEELERVITNTVIASSEESFEQVVIIAQQIWTEQCQEYENYVKENNI